MFDSPHGFMTINDYAKPSQTDKKDAPKNWIIELKYDGTRHFLISTDTDAELYNKRGLDKTRHFPEITKKSDIPAGTVLDGETIVTDDLHPHGNKNVLQKRDGGKPVLRKSGRKNFKPKLKMKQYPATFVAFDILRYKGENLRNKPIEERRKILEEVVANAGESVRKAERFNTIGEGWERVTDQKMEGIILKQPETSYPEGRTQTWKKVKNIKDTLRTIKDYEEHQKGITIITEKNDRVTVNGRQSQEVKRFVDNKDNVKCEISYLEKTENDSLREPTWKRLVK